MGCCFWKRSGSSLNVCWKEVAWRGRDRAAAGQHPPPGCEERPERTLPGLSPAPRGHTTRRAETQDTEPRLLSGRARREGPRLTRGKYFVQKKRF